MTLDPTLRDQLARVIHDAACRCGGRIHHRHYLTAADKAAELRRELDDMRGLALREGVYNGNSAVLNIIERVEPLLDAAAERDALAAKLDAVRELYQACTCCGEDPSCEACDSMTYPCATIRALDATPETGGEPTPPHQEDSSMTSQPEPALGPTNSPNPTPSATQPPTEPHNTEGA